MSSPDSVLDLIDPYFTDRRDRPAVVDGTGSLTYGELDIATATIARSLAARGVRPEDAVIVQSPLSRWAIALILGVLRAGARYVPIDTAFPPTRQRLLARLSGAALTVTPPGLVPEPGRPGTTLADLIRDAPSGGAPHGAGMLAYTQFTSGSTGTPKPVTVPTAALAYSTQARLCHYDEPVDAFLLCSSISFDSSVAGIFWTLGAGGALIIPAERPTNVVAIAEAARAQRASHALMIPSLYELLLTPELRPCLRDMHTLIVAGEICPPRLVRQHFAALPAARLVNEYGPTECTVWSTVHDCRPGDADQLSVPIGRPIPGARVYLRAETGAAVAPGEAGELWIGGPGVVGPTERREETMAVVGGEPAYRTGDLVSVGEGGALIFHGRQDGQVKIGGLRLELGELENVLADDDSVAQAAVGVAGRLTPHPYLVAFIVPSASTLDIARLRAHVLSTMPALACPARFVARADLPLQPNGKVDQRALDELAAQRFDAVGVQL